MPSIAQTILDKYNGVVDNVQSAVSQVADAGIAALTKVKKPKQQIVLTEEDRRIKEMLRSTLRSGAWMVDYKKVDGTPATMECTLDPQLLPPQTIFAGAEAGKEQPEYLLAVYAVDRQGWRSFVTKNVTRVYKKPA